MDATTAVDERGGAGRLTAPAGADDDGPASGDGPTRVVTVQKRAPAPGARPTAEQQIPFGDTGTFGKF